MLSIEELLIVLGRQINFDGGQKAVAIGCSRPEEYREKWRGIKFARVTRSKGKGSASLPLQKTG
jgi:acetyl-CoA carboxylase alpha subunit